DAHYAEHRFVPFAAQDDLLKSLATAGLLDTSAGPIPVTRRKRSWMARATVELAHPRIPGTAILSVLVVLGSIAALILLRPRADPELSAWDVLLAYPGAVLGLSLRRFFQSAALVPFGERPSHFEIGATFGAIFIGPDADGLVLLDRPRRARVHLFAIVGGAVAFVIAQKLSQGLAFGAAMAVLCDLCPFAPTSAGKLLATIAGKVDLREHARAYLDRRILKRFTTSHTFEGEGSLIFSALLSLAWLGLVIRLLLVRGRVAILRLLAESIDSVGVAKVLCLAGAVFVALLMIASFVMLIVTVFRAFLSLRPPQSAAPGSKVTKTEQTDLAHIPLFARLAPDEVSSLTKAGEELHYEPGHAIVVQGELGDRFFAILSGEVAVEHEADSGLRRQIARLNAGDCFGETALLEGGHRTATVRAVTNTVVLALSREAFDRARAGLKDEQISAVLRAAAALKRSTFFGSIPTERLSALALKLQPRRVQRGDVVIQLGDRGDDFFLVSEGSLEVLDPEGQTVATLGPGDHFGEVALLRDVPRTATVRAMAGSLILALNKQAFLSAIASDLALSSRIEAFAAERAEGR
ncbi:MAG: cyclic nucleotide-binding domain-containing protein, partial [Myxococcaceae bacterium]